MIDKTERLSKIHGAELARPLAVGVRLCLERRKALLSICGQSPADLAGTPSYNRLPGMIRPTGRTKKVLAAIKPFGLTPGGPGWSEAHFPAPTTAHCRCPPAFYPPRNGGGKVKTTRGRSCLGRGRATLLSRKALTFTRRLADD